jgi:hypothetical protein
MKEIIKIRAGINGKTMPRIRNPKIWLFIYGTGLELRATP